MSSTSIVCLVSLCWVAQARGDLGDWQRVTSPAEGFSVLVPPQAQWKLLRQNANDGLGDSHTIVAESGGVTFIASVAEIRPPVTPDKYDEFFDGIKKSYAQGKGRTLKREQRGGKIHGMPICFFNVNSVGADGKPRNEQSRFLIGDPTHALTMQVVVPPGREVNDEIRKFFNSVEYHPGQAGKPAPSPTPVAAKWRVFSPKGQRFTVQMPGEPKVEHKDLPNEQVGIDTYEVELGNRTFSAAAYTMPAAVADRPASVTLDNLGQGIVNGMKGKVAASKPTTKQGLEGREMTFSLNMPSGAPAEARLVAYADGLHVYALLYGGPPGSTTTAEVTKFLDSFHLNDQTTTTAPRKAGLPRKK